MRFHVHTDNCLSFNAKLVRYIKFLCVMSLTKGFYNLYDLLIVLVFASR